MEGIRELSSLNRPYRSRQAGVARDVPVVPTFVLCRPGQTLLLVDIRYLGMSYGPTADQDLLGNQSYQSKLSVLWL